MCPSCRTKTLFVGDKDAPGGLQAQVRRNGDPRQPLRAVMAGGGQAGFPVAQRGPVGVSVPSPRPAAGPQGAGPSDSPRHPTQNCRIVLKPAHRPRAAPTATVPRPKSHAQTGTPAGSPTSLLPAVTSRCPLGKPQELPAGGHTPAHTAPCLSLVGEKGCPDRSYPGEREPQYAYLMCPLGKYRDFWSLRRQPNHMAGGQGIRRADDGGAVSRAPRESGGKPSLESGPG